MYYNMINCDSGVEKIIMQLTTQKCTKSGTKHKRIITDSFVYESFVKKIVEKKETKQIREVRAGSHRVYDRLNMG